MASVRLECLSDDVLVLQNQHNDLNNFVERGTEGCSRGSALAREVATTKENGALEMASQNFRKLRSQGTDKLHTRAIAQIEPTTVLYARK